MVWQTNFAPGCCLNNLTNLDSLKDTVSQLYGQKVRVRVCGVLVSEEGLLLAEHKGIGNAGSLWVPPGGGVEFGERMQSALIREFAEETGLQVEVKELLLVNEFVEPPLHAIELFFKVERLGGELQTGTDPEMQPQAQVLQQVRFMTLREIQRQPPLTLHSSLRGILSFAELLQPRQILRMDRV